MAGNDPVWTTSNTTIGPVGIDDLRLTFDALDAAIQKHRAEIARLDPDGSKGRWLDLVTKEGATIVAHPDRAAQVREAFPFSEVIASPMMEAGQLLAIKRDPPRVCATCGSTLPRWGISSADCWCAGLPGAGAG